MKIATNLGRVEITQAETDADGNYRAHIKATDGDVPYFDDDWVCINPPSDDALSASLSALLSKRKAAQ